MRPKSLPAEVLKKVRRLQIVAGRRVDEALIGQYRSVFRGGGIEFCLEVSVAAPDERQLHVERSKRWRQLWWHQYGHADRERHHHRHEWEFIPMRHQQR